jgi:hypothetical protein
MFKVIAFRRRARNSASAGQAYTLAWGPPAATFAGSTIDLDPVQSVTLAKTSHAKADHPLWQMGVAVRSDYANAHVLDLVTVDGDATVA